MREEIVICWWGADLRILGPGGRLAGRALDGTDDAVGAIVETIASEFPKAAAARIVYQPDSVEIHEIAIRRTDRKGLRRMLAAEFRALEEPETVWAVEPGPENTGLLHVSRNSKLPRLASELARARIGVDGAWPLLSLLEDSRSAGQGHLSLVALSRRALVACRSPGGSRLVRACTAGDDAGLRNAAHEAMARFDEAEPPEGWLVAEEGPADAAVREAAAGLPLTELSPAEFLRRARLLDQGRPSNFLYQAHLFSRRGLPTVAAALALILFGGAAANAGLAFERKTRWREQNLADQARRTEQMREAAAGLALKGRIEALNGALERARCPPQHHYALLLALARAVPNTVVLRSLAIDGGKFTLVGRLCRPGAENPLPGLERELSRPGAPWRLLDKPALSSDSEFVIKGSFQSAAVP